MMKVRVDASRCTGHARCHAVAPDAFPLDEDGFTRLRGGEAQVSADRYDLVRRAAAACPERAIEVVER